MKYRMDFHALNKLYEYDSSSLNTLLNSGNSCMKLIYVFKTNVSLRQNFGG